MLETNLVTKRVGLFKWSVVGAQLYVTKDGREKFVEDGYICDLASIPRLLWVLWPPSGGPWADAAVFHDWDYDHGDDRLQADKDFREIMLERGTDPATAETMYRAVRWFGGWRYYKRRGVKWTRRTKNARRERR